MRKDRLEPNRDAPTSIITTITSGYAAKNKNESAWLCLSPSPFDINISHFRNKMYFYLQTQNSNRKIFPKVECNRLNMSSLAFLFRLRSGTKWNGFLDSQWNNRFRFIDLDLWKAHLLLFSQNCLSRIFIYLRVLFVEDFHLSLIYLILRRRCIIFLHVSKNITISWRKRMHLVFDHSLFIRSKCLIELYKN